MSPSPLHHSAFTQCHLRVDLYVKINNKNLMPIVTLFLDCQVSFLFCFPSLCTPHPQ